MNENYTGVYTQQKYYYRHIGLKILLANVEIVTKHWWGSFHWDTLYTCINILATVYQQKPNHLDNTTQRSAIQYTLRQCKMKECTELLCVVLAALSN